MSTPDVRWTARRPDGGEVRVSILRAPDGRPYVEVGRYGANGEPMARIGIQLEELDRLAEVIGRVRELTLGHPRHAATAPHPCLGGAQ